MRNYVLQNMELDDVRVCSDLCVCVCVCIYSM